MIPDRFNDYLKKLIECAPLYDDVGHGASTFEEGISRNHDGDLQQHSDGELFGSGIETENLGDTSLTGSCNLQNETVEGSEIDEPLPESEISDINVLNILNHVDVTVADLSSSKKKKKKLKLVADLSSKKKKKNKVKFNLGSADIVDLETENLGDTSLTGSCNLQDETADGAFNETDISYVESITNVEGSEIDEPLPEREMSDINVINHDDVAVTDLSSSKKKKKNKLKLAADLSSSKKKKKNKLKFKLGSANIVDIENENLEDTSLNDTDISYVESIANVEGSGIDAKTEREMSDINVLNVINHGNVAVADLSSSSKKKKNKVKLDANLSSSSKKKKDKVKFNLATSSDTISVIQDGAQQVSNSENETTVVNVDEADVPEYNNVGKKKKKRKLNGDQSLSSKMKKLKK